MKIQIEEKDLVFLLNCASNSADFDEYEKGWKESADKTHALVRSAVFNINHQLGYEKYCYDKEFGVTEVKQREN